MSTSTPMPPERISVCLDEPMDWPDPPGLAGMSAEDIAGWYLLYADCANRDEHDRIAAVVAALPPPKAAGE